MTKLAFDRIALPDQYMDQDGRVHYAGATISIAMVSPYLGREIPNYQSLGLEPQKIYKLLRDPAELAAAVSTFNGLQLMDNHIHVSASSPAKDKIAGTIGTRAEFDGRCLKNDITVWVGESVDRIKMRKQRELSSSYYYDAVMEPGEFEGQPYDGRMTNIRGNHVALVDEGRVGPEAALDRAITKGNAMAYKRNAAQMLKHLTAEIASGKIAADASPEELKKSMDADPDADPVGDDDETEEERKTREAKEAKDKAKDKAAKDKAAKDKAAKDAEEAAAKAKADEEDEDDEDDKKAGEANDAKIKAAVDAAIKGERQRNADANEARALVRPLVGEVVGLDSADAILQYALKQKGVAFDGINLPGLKALVGAHLAVHAPARPRIANDAAAADLSTRLGVSAPRKL